MRIINMCPDDAHGIHPENTLFWQWLDAVKEIEAYQDLRRAVTIYLDAYLLPDDVGFSQKHLERLSVIHSLFWYSQCVQEGEYVH